MQTRKYDNQPSLTLATFGSIFSEFSTDINMPKLTNCCRVLYFLCLRASGTQLYLFQNIPPDKTSIEDTNSYDRQGRFTSRNSRTKKVKSKIRKGLLCLTHSKCWLRRTLTDIQHATDHPRIHMSRDRSLRAWQLSRSLIWCHVTRRMKVKLVQVKTTQNVFERRFCRFSSSELDVTKTWNG